jgi:Ca2+-dependent lipid-binding protein
MYSTRVIQKCLEPTFEETCAILITPEHIKANESLSLQLWDSDRFSADDLLGKVEVDVNDLLRKAKNGEMEMEERSDDLVGFDSEKPEPGKLFWSGKLREEVINLVGFYKKRKFNMDLKTDGSDPRVPKDLSDHDIMEDKKRKTDTKNEAASVFVPPDPDYPSGILSIQIHQANNVEIQDVKGTYGSQQKWQPGQTNTDGTPRPNPTP